MFNSELDDGGENSSIGVTLQEENTTIPALLSPKVDELVLKEFETNSMDYVEKRRSELGKPAGFSC